VVAGFATQVTQAAQQWGIPVSSPGSVTVGGGAGSVGTDLFRPLRKHNLHTREAWTAIPASEGARILDLVRPFPTPRIIHNFPFSFQSRESGTPRSKTSSILY
jgi:hypothetical protein